MAENEQTPEPAEKPKDDTPVERNVSAEQPASETPPVQEAGFEQPQAVQESTGSKETNKDARMWGMICHLAALAGIVVPVVGCVVGPLIIWQIKKDEFGFVGDQGKEAVNFQITILIYLIVSGLLTFLCIGFVLLPAVGIFDFVFMLIAAVKANDGEHYRYPLTVRFIK